MCSNCSGDYENPDVTQWDREATEDECNEAIALGAQQEDDPVCTQCGHSRSAHREEMPYECNDLCECKGFSYIPKSEQEQIIEASRSVRAGTDMLFAALRKAGCL